MINPASLSFKGKVYYNTNTENSRGGGGKENTAQNKLKCPKENRSKIIDELNLLKAELEEKTPEEDERSVEFKADVNNAYFPPSVYLSVKNLNDSNKHTYMVIGSESIGYDSDRKFAYFEGEQLSKTIDTFFSKIKKKVFLNIEKMHNPKEDDNLKSIMDRLV